MFFDDTRRRFRRAAGSLVALTVLAAAAACGGDDGGSGGSGDGAGTASTVRLGYFPNVTHATRGGRRRQGLLREAARLDQARDADLQRRPGRDRGLLAGDLDAGFIGPNPAINAFAKSNGRGHPDHLRRRVRRARSLVVKPGINTAADLKGKRIATPQLGNTQDVALRAWLKEQRADGRPAGREGDVQVEPSENATTLQLFQDRQDRRRLGAGAVGVPAGARGRRQGALDEKTLWPDGKFVTTHLIVRTEFLEKHPATVKALLRGRTSTPTSGSPSNPDEAKTAVNDEHRARSPTASRSRPRCWTGPGRTSRSPTTRWPRR